MIIKHLSEAEAIVKISVNRRTVVCMHDVVENKNKVQIKTVITIFLVSISINGTHKNSFSLCKLALQLVHNQQQNVQKRNYSHSTTV